MSRFFRRQTRDWCSMRNLTDMFVIDYVLWGEYNVGVGIATNDPNNPTHILAERECRSTAKRIVLTQRQPLNVEMLYSSSVFLVFFLMFDFKFWFGTYISMTQEVRCILSKCEYWLWPGAWIWIERGIFKSRHHQHDTGIVFGPSTSQLAVRVAFPQVVGVSLWQVEVTYSWTDSRCAVFHIKAWATHPSAHLPSRRRPPTLRCESTLGGLVGGGSTVGMRGSTRGWGRALLRGGKWDQKNRVQKVCLYWICVDYVV